MLTCVYPSAAVEYTWVFLMGMVVFLSIILLKTPPMVSIPRDKGATSTNTISLISPLRTAPCIAAPIEIASSGLTPFEGFF